MKKLSFSKGLVFLTTALFLVGGFFVANTARATGSWTVNPACISTTPPACDDLTTFKTIQEAIIAATDDDIINVTVGTYPENITVGKSLTIQGTGDVTHIIGGIDANGANVTIKDLKITNSNPDDSGVSDFGVKMTAGKALTLGHVTVDVLHDAISMISNSTTNGTALTINNSTIKGYGALVITGAINSAGTQSAVVTINNTSLTGSTSYSGTIDDFSTIGLDNAQHVSVVFTGSSSVANEYTGGAQAKERLITFWDASNNSVTGTPTYTNGHSEINDDALFVSGGYDPELGYSATNTVASKIVGRYVYNTATFEAALTPGVAIPIIVGRAENPIVTNSGTQTLVAGAKLIIEAPDSTPVTISAGTTLVNNGTIIIETGATLINNGALQSASIAGTATNGQLLTATITGLTGAGTPSYQWKRDGVDIGEATASTYTLVSADVGKVITVTATMTGITGAGFITSAGTATVNELAPTLSLSGVPATVTTETAIPETSGVIGSSFDTTKGTLIQATLTKGSADYSNVRVVVTGLNSGVQLIAQDTTGIWYNIAVTGWGPTDGFNLATVTTPVYLVANTAGTYTATINLVNVSNSNAVLATTTATVTANAPTPPPSHGGGGGYLHAATPAVPANVTTPKDCAPGDKFSTTTGRNCNAATPAVPAGKVLGAGTFNFTMFLKWGPPFNVKVKGPEVMELQKFLNTAGYGPLVVDGLFGGRTKSALVKYQIANGLKGDGVVGPLTRAALNK